MKDFTQTNGRAKDTLEICWNNVLRDKHFYLGEGRGGERLKAGSLQLERRNHGRRKMFANGRNLTRRLSRHWLLTLMGDKQASGDTSCS